MGPHAACECDSLFYNQQRGTWALPLQHQPGTLRGSCVLHAALISATRLPLLPHPALAHPCLASLPHRHHAHTHRLQKDWPFCNPCKDDQSCYEFKPGVSKCITKTESGEAFLKEGELCMDFSGKKRKWAGSNPKLFGMSCQWPQFSCNYDTEADNGTYK